MHPHTRWWERLVRGSPPHKAARASSARIVSEVTFHELIAVERARSAKCGQLCWILTVYLGGGSGTMTPMTGKFSQRVIAVLLGHLRTTDHIGWYREGWIIGALLTVVDPRHAEGQCQSPAQRLGRILRVGFPDLGDSLFIRMCEYEELQQFTS